VSTETWAAALVVLAAILVGVAIPVLVQLRATLRAAEAVLQRSGPRLDEAMAATTAAAGRIAAVVHRLEEGGRIEGLLDGLAALSHAMIQLKDTLRVASAIGAAVGPAVAAAVHAFTEDRPQPPVSSGDGVHAAEQHEPSQER
jgi:hypothetical protein